MSTDTRTSCHFTPSFASVKKTSNAETFQCMIDIETLGLEPDSAIMAISYVIFDKECLDFSKSIKYFRTINLIIDDQVSKYERTTSEKTIQFWNKPELSCVKKVLEKNQVDLKTGLLTMSEELFNIRINEFWANSPDFDLGILESAFKSAGIKERIPWVFHKKRDVRTIFRMFQCIFPGEFNEKTMFEAVLNLGLDENLLREHHPLFDCLLQIWKVSDFISSCKEGKRDKATSPSLKEILQTKKLKMDLDIKSVQFY